MCLCSNWGSKRLLGEPVVIENKWVCRMSESKNECSYFLLRIIQIVWCFPSMKRETYFQFPPIALLVGQHWELKLGRGSDGGRGGFFLSFCLWEREKRENQCFNFVCLLALHTLEAKKHKHFSMLSTKFEITPKKKKNYWLGLYTEKRIYCCKHNYEWTIICLLPFFSFGISCTTLWKMIRNKEKCSTTWHINHKYTL